MEKNVCSQTIANAINTYLKENDWHFRFDEEKCIFRFGLNLKTKLKSINYVVLVKDDNYSVYAVSPINTDADDSDMMQKMAEFVCRANYGLKNGNFELDMRDGEIRYKCFVDCAEEAPSDAMIQNSIYCPAGMFKIYGQGILSIIFGGATAEEAVELCESDLR